MKGEENGSALVVIMIFTAAVILFFSPLVAQNINAYKHSTIRGQTNLNQY